MVKKYKDRETTTRRDVTPAEEFQTKNEWESVGQLTVATNNPKLQPRVKEEL